MSADLPSYFLTRPAWTPSLAQEEALQGWLAGTVRPGGNALTRPPKGVSVWQALAWLGETDDVLLHGTGEPDISVFVPRQPVDLGAFGSQRAVYAASDGVWAMFYAVLDRVKYPTTINNGAFVLRRGETALGPFYFFSVSEEALAQRPFRAGWVYVLPRAGFSEEAPKPYGPYLAHTHHWASLNSVRPLVRLAVQPQDFPFLEHIRPHDEATLHRRMRENPGGFPWVDA